MFHDRLIAASLQLFIRVTYAWAQWTMPSSETPSIFMSDSSVEERPPPDRPAGPPPPIPVQAQQDLAHHVSTVVADAIGFQGSILCYLPWDLRHLKCLVVSIRAMRPHERRHPNVLEIRDAPSAEEADRAEAGDAEGDHVDAPESATEASMEAGVESTHGIEASSSGHGGTEGHPESLVNHTIRRMEAEGRSVMTSAEIAAIQADFDAASEEENTVTFDHLFGEESHADGGTGDGDDASETHNATDTRAASSGSTPQAKPRALGQKKRGTHLYSFQDFVTPWAGPAEKAEHGTEDASAKANLPDAHYSDMERRPRHHQLATFSFGTLSSQIDFIMCRMSGNLVLLKHSNTFETGFTKVYRKFIQQHLDLKLLLKRPRRRQNKAICIRNGHMMTPENELDWIVEAFGDRYGVADLWHQLESPGHVRTLQRAMMKHVRVWHPHGQEPPGQGWNEKISASLQNTMADEEPLSDADKEDPQGSERAPAPLRQNQALTTWTTVGKWQTVDVTDEAMNLANASTTNPAYSPDDRRMANFDAEMDEFFGPVKDEVTGNENQDPNKISPFALSFGPNKRRRNPFEEQTHHHAHPATHHRGSRDPLLFNLAKTVIKQQEELRVLRQDTALILFFMPGRDTVLNHLYTTAFRFKAKQAEEPAWTLGQQPMRMVLAMALFKELVDRLNSTISSQEKLKRVTDQGWRDSTGWRYQVWNRSTRQLEADPQRTPIPDDQLLDHLATVLQCLKHPILTRFACTRRMAETMTSQATFKMDVALRSHSALTFWDEMQVLRGNSVFQLVGMGYKTESLGRGPAEQKLLDMMYGRK
ncbi:unnamed protein product [Symbiodinium sp. KB8]|nr:unnamed protein product [Symbiodinium sp. KB8]